MYSTLTNIIIPVSSDCYMSEASDSFAIDTILNSFPLSPIENGLSQEGNPFEYLEVSPNKRNILWR